MYTIEYDIYYKDDDFRNKSKCKSVFPGLKNIGDFLIENAVDAPCSLGLKVYYDNLGINITGLESSNYDSQKTIKIHTIKDENNSILYSSGKYTQGIKHISEKVFNFFCSLQIEYEKPGYYMDHLDDIQNIDTVDMLIDKCEAIKEFVDSKEENDIYKNRQQDLKVFLDEVSNVLEEYKELTSIIKPAKRNSVLRR